MTFREGIGVGFIVVGLLLLPAAWAFSRVLWLLSFSIFVVGIWLFYTRRVLSRQAQIEKTRGGQQSGECTPTDIHNYTGWQQGGRSKSMDTSSEIIDADGD
jgi:membrane protein implicated in regulation of membrane protease activity